MEDKVSIPANIYGEIPYGDALASYLTIRDYIAIVALQGLLANSALDAWKTELATESYADDAYRMADEMLKARNRI
jgi:hypothetical protein